MKNDQRIKAINGKMPALAPAAPRGAAGQGLWKIILPLIF